MLRLLHAHRPPRRWLLKFPNYLFQLPDVVAQYPDARFVMTHRDPEAVIPSTCSVVAGPKERVPSWSPDPAAFGHEMLEHFTAAMQRAMADRTALGEDRFLDVGQYELEHDAVATAERICDFAGIDFAGDVRTAMTDWAAGNRRGSRGEHRYSAAEFGLTSEEIREAFADYLAAYGELCRPHAR